MTDQPINVEDVSEKRGFFRGLGEVFASGSPHSGFYRVLLLIMVLGSVTWWWWFIKGDDERAVQATSDSTGFDDRGGEVREVPEHIVKQELKKDQQEAASKRGSGENYAGVRPASGKKSFDEILKGNKPPKPEPKPAPKPEPVAQASVFKQPSNLGLDSAQAVATTKVQVTTYKKPRSSNPIMAYVLKQQENEDKERKFLSGTLVQYTSEPVASIPSDKAAESPADELQLPQTETEEKDEQILAQRAGHFSYGVSMTAVDTDVASTEVVAEIIGGDLDGARLIGTWARLGNVYEDLSLTFKTMEFETEVYAVDLVAFSPSSHLPAFVSEVDRHLLQRWGGLLSGALLEGANAAVLASATSADPDAVLAASSTLIDSDELRNIFYSETGSRIAEKLKDNYDRPITSRVWVGQDMRLLALKPIYVKKQI